MISKELLSAVLENDYNERLVDIIQINGNLLQTFYDCGSGKPTGLGIEINIHELAHKCKEWAYNEGYYLIEKVGSVEVYSGILLHIADSLDTPYSPNNTILACQWILDNKETK